MRLFSLGLLLLTLTAGGCVSRAKSEARAQAAFAAGQQHATTQLLESRRTSIRVIGSVRNPEIPWMDDLTLAEALVAADYASPRDPRQIVIIRRGERLPVEPQALLRGEDFLLAPGDTIELLP
ncbi:MAG: MoaD/ThiS family protein [Verrucomicrobiae bacterium]|nr:MoaD/ThiS family protein [Verrucomicrobiae bacterium]